MKEPRVSSEVIAPFLRVVIIELHDFRRITPPVGLSSLIRGRRKVGWGGRKELERRNEKTFC